MSINILIFLSEWYLQLLVYIKFLKKALQNCFFNNQIYSPHAQIITRTWAYKFIFKKVKFPEYKSLQDQIDGNNLFNRYLLTRQLLRTFLRINDSRKKSIENILLKSLDNKFIYGYTCKSYP